MKSILLLCLWGISSALTCFFKNAGEYPIPVFRSAYSNKCISEVQDDTINECWSEVEIIKKQGDRYKVKIHNESLMVHLIGWISKEECGVYLYPKDRTEDDVTLKFFSRANDQVPCLVFPLDDDYNCDFIKNHLVPIVDFNTKNRRIKVNIILKTGEIKSLWTSDYCNRIYGCEGN